MGWGVEHDETFAARLEAQTGRRVLNAGVSSYGTARESILLRRLDLENLDVLVVQYCPNDHPENERFLNNDRQLPISSAETWRQAVEAHLQRTAYYPFKHTLSLPRFVRQKPAPEPRTEGSAQRQTVLKPRRHDPATAFLEILGDQLVAALSPESSGRAGSGSSDTAPSVVIFSLEAESVHDQFVRSVEKAVAQNERLRPLRDRFHYVDLTGRIGPEHRFVLDPHLNTTGHRIVADALMEHLQTILGATAP